jgi:molybdopterin converting factor small subunit
MGTISIRYWAGARAAAGVPAEEVEAASVAEALAIARDRRGSAHFDRVLAMSALLVDGVTLHADDLDHPVGQRVEVEVLPPFAGG